MPVSSAGDAAITPPRQSLIANARVSRRGGVGAQRRFVPAARRLRALKRRKFQAGEKLTRVGTAVALSRSMHRRRGVYLDGVRPHSCGVHEKTYRGQEAMIHSTVNAARLAACAIVLSTLLSACGGGGSDAAGTTSAASGADATSDPALVEAERKNPPTIAGSPTTSVVAGQPYGFQPTASSANGGALTFSVTNKPAWAAFDTATGRLTGTPATADVGTFGNIAISVADSRGNTASLPVFAIAVTAPGTTVRSATLSWQAPTKNIDGTPVTDLKGYRIRYGTASGAYTQTLAVDDPATTRYVVDGLTAGTYYFTVTAYNTAGAESDPAPEVSKTVDN